MIDPDHPPRWWTVEEANAALARVAEAVERARVAAIAPAGNGHAGAFERAISALEADGIVLRDPERGLVDFPARAPNGRGYWLCWLIDEPAVEWWHWPEDGFPGRTPLTQPPP